MILVLLLFMAALSLEGIGTYISVIGLAATFAADPVILTMAVVLDFCKVIAVNTLAKSWSKLSRAIRVYMICSTLVLSLITSAGVAGYLSNSFQKAMLPNQGNDIALTNIKAEQERLQSRKAEIDKQISQLPPNAIAGRQRLMKSFQPETDHINQRLNEIDTELPKLQTSQAKIHTDVGSIMFLADAANIAPTKAVGIIIALIIFVFDPMAIVFLISANNLWSRRSEDKKKEEEEKKNELTNIPMQEDYTFGDPNPTPPSPKVQEAIDKLYKHLDDNPPVRVELVKPSVVEEAVQYFNEGIDPFPAESIVEPIEDLSVFEETDQAIQEAAAEFAEMFITEPAKIEDPANWPFPIDPDYKPKVELELVPVEEPKPEIEFIHHEEDEPPEDVEIVEPQTLLLEGPKPESIDSNKVEKEKGSGSFILWNMDRYPYAPQIPQGVIDFMLNPEPNKLWVERVEEPEYEVPPEAEFEPTLIVKPEIEEVLKEILTDTSSPLSDEEREKLDRALDKVALDGEEERKIEELVVQQVANKTLPDADLTHQVSLLDDPSLDHVKGSKVHHIGTHWVNPKLLEIYSSNP